MMVMQRNWQSLRAAQKFGFFVWATLLGLLMLWAMWQHCICSPQTTRIGPAREFFPPESVPGTVSRLS